MHKLGNRSITCQKIDCMFDILACSLIEFHPVFTAIRFLFALRLTYDIDRLISEMRVVMEGRTWVGQRTQKLVMPHSP